MYICIYVYMYIVIYSYTHTHTHTHTQFSYIINIWQWGCARLLLCGMHICCCAYIYDIERSDCF